MSDYPHDWRRRDIVAATAVLGATSCAPPGPNAMPGHLLQAIFTFDGYPAQLSEWERHHRRWVEAEFTVPPTWPMFTLIRRHGPDDGSPPASSGEFTEHWFRLADLAGCELWTPDAARTQQLFDRGLAEVVPQHPLERLRIGSPSASFRSANGARLNGHAARWALDLIRPMLAGAPPFESLKLIDVSPGVAWTQEHLDRRVGINPDDPDKPY